MKPNIFNHLKNYKRIKALLAMGGNSQTGNIKQICSFPMVNNGSKHHFTCFIFKSYLVEINNNT